MVVAKRKKRVPLSWVSFLREDLTARVLESREVADMCRAGLTATGKSSAAKRLRTYLHNRLHLHTPVGVCEHAMANHYRDIVSAALRALGTPSAPVVPEVPSDAVELLKGSVGFNGFDALGRLVAALFAVCPQRAAGIIQRAVEEGEHA